MDVQCYELFGGIALKNHAFSFFHFSYEHIYVYVHKVHSADSHVTLR